MNMYSKTALAGAISATLTACSGGSTSNDNSNPASKGNSGGQQSAAVTVERVSLTGLAVKGTVRNAKVELFKVINGQLSGTPLATGSTNAAGQYSLLAISDAPYSGPALIKVSHQAGAEIQCDSKNAGQANADGCGNYASASDSRNTINPGSNKIDFTEYYDLPANFVMTSAIPRINTSQLSNELLTANVTSLTHIAAQYASSNNVVLNEETIRQLNNRVRFIFGLDSDVDLVSSTPGDITQADSSTETEVVRAAQYAALTAALAQIATQTNKSIDAVLTDFAKDFSDNKGKLFWNANGANGQITIAAILAAAEAIAQGQSTAAENKLASEKNAAGSKSGTENQNPPTAIPPTDQKITIGNQVVLKGTSDQSGVTYSWSQISGPALSGVTFPVTGQNLSLTPNTVGNYEFRLTVSKASQNGSARVILGVEAKPGAASLVAGKYSIIAGTADFGVTDPNGNNRSLALELGTERTTGFELKAGPANSLTLSTDGTIEQDWDLNQSYALNAVFSGTNAPKSTITGDLSKADIETGSGSQPGQIDSQGNIAINTSASSNIRDNRVDYTFARRVNFVEVAPGSYLSTQLAQEIEVGKTADNKPDFSDRKRESVIVDTLILNKDDGSFKAENIQPKYGVISVELGSDESNGQAIASELQSWETTATSSGFNLKRKTDASANKIGRVVSRFAAGLLFNGSGYDEITATSLRNSVTTAKDTNGEANDSSPLPAFYIANGSSLFNIPSSLLDQALKGYSDSSAIFEGLFSPKGEMINVNLMIKGSLGQFNSTKVITQVLNRNIGVAIDSADPGNMTGEYRIQGVEYGIRKGKPGVQAAALNGRLSLQNTTANFEVHSDDVSLNAENNFFGVNVRSERNKGTLNVTTAANGRITLSDDGTTMEGFISTDKKRIVLRLISKETLDSANTPANQADEARHGYIVATLIEDQPAQ